MAISIDEPYACDALFESEGPLNRDDCLAAFRLLRDRIEAGGGRCHTADVFANAGWRPDVVLFIDVPEVPFSVWPGVPRWIVLQESEVVLPRNWDTARQAEFEQVFTWRDPLVDGVRFHKLNFPNLISTPDPLDLESAERNLCVMIAADKYSPHPLELYSARRETIAWFEQHHPTEFALFGVRWPPRLSYRGPVERKRDALGAHWFSICFENARDIPGYITEKLIDCLLARTVPIYLGAPHITDHVPAQCFIDMRRFSSYEDLYAHLRRMEPEEYVVHLDAGRAFLAGSGGAAFSIERHADTIVSALAA